MCSRTRAEQFGFFENYCRSKSLAWQTVPGGSDYTMVFDVTDRLQNFFVGVLTLLVAWTCGMRLKRIHKPGGNKSYTITLISCTVWLDLDHVFVAENVCENVHVTLAYYSLRFVRVQSQVWTKSSEMFIKKLIQVQNNVCRCNCATKRLKKDIHHSHEISQKIHLHSVQHLPQWSDSTFPK